MNDAGRIWPRSIRDYGWEPAAEFGPNTMGQIWTVVHAKPGFGYFIRYAALAVSGPNNFYYPGYITLFCLQAHWVQLTMTLNKLQLLLYGIRVL